MRSSKREPDASKWSYQMGNEDTEIKDEPTKNVTDAPKRKRKQTDTSDNRFLCTEDGCGKSYSRAEHLHRHQLNHAPKQIFYCDFGGCDRHFVRQDLCARHRERHFNTNSQLSRRFATKSARRSVEDADSSGPTGESARVKRSRSHHSTATARSTEQSSPASSDTYAGSKAKLELPEDVKVANHAVTSILNPRRLDDTSTSYPISTSEAFSLSACSDQRSRSDVEDRLADVSYFLKTNTSSSIAHGRESSANNGRRLSPSRYNNQRSKDHSSHLPQPQPVQEETHAPNLLTSYSVHRTEPQCQMQGRSSNSFSFPDFSIRHTALPSLRFSSLMSQDSNFMRSDSATSFIMKSTDPYSQTMTISHDGHFDDSTLLQAFPNVTTAPVFNQETFNHFQFGMGDDFMDWLFGDEQRRLMSSPIPYNPNSLQDSYPGTGKQHQTGFGVELDPVPSVTPIPSVLDSGQPESMLSASRRLSLLKFIRKEFIDIKHTEVTKRGQKLLQGDLDQDGHVLSLRMLQVYISSFWLHTHTQLPIMHRPTFSAETCPDLLLIAVMTLGASCLEKSHGVETTQACAELSFFLAWHARHLILRDPEFSAPAKLWVFQALLLLEIFEKLYSTRSLHERAHVHHATTLTLMRRGSSLIGRSAVYPALVDEDPTRSPPGPNGSINTSGQNTSDAWWNIWISNEATRRAAFAAFILDVTHATMFCHSAVMAPHEMRIALPCDEALWSATSGEEARRLEQSLESRALKPLSFLEGLRKTLNCQPIQTNTFGRVTIMAGLLSVSWHMKMQEVRVHSVGVGKQSSWVAQLKNAFDHWKRDFDTSLEHTNRNYNHQWINSYGVDVENVFESRTVLHHLAHMAINVDFIDCQIFAGAKRLLGRDVTSNEHAAVAKRMKESWARSKRGREATFYALRFLSEVLLPKDDSVGTTHHTTPGFLYSARDDHLLNRPWVLYLATLTVWAYGYALDGPIAPPTYTFSSLDNTIYDMSCFLKRVGGIRTPDDLQFVEQRNNCLGLLMLLRDDFCMARWELLHEASAMLGNCIRLLMPGI
ncbi:hypothetical protein AAFC00_004638 [Neodothiora populina]|uniref:C2H2-type domain-containing protein n=1 Tax=Neodothiora populina TaxID=2781224 RepID=A0ABR3P306_9PEZI